jgi:hypothetical protein
MMPTEVPWQERPCAHCGQALTDAALVLAGAMKIDGKIVYVSHALAVVCSKDCLVAWTAAQA